MTAPHSRARNPFSPAFAGAIALAVAGTLGAGIVVVPALASAAKKDTALTISSRVPAFHGNVSSTYSPCVGDRKIELVLKSGSERKTIGHDRSTSGGRWTIEVRDLQSGAYYAKAERQTVSGRGGSLVCRAARSEVVVVG